MGLPNPKPLQMVRRTYPNVRLDAINLQTLLMPFAQPKVTVT